MSSVNKSYQQEEEFSLESGLAPAASSTSRSNRSVKYAFALIVSIAFVFAVSFSQSGKTATTSNLFTAMEADSSTEVSVSINTPGYSAVTSTSMLPWDTIAEPYKTQILTLSSVSIGGVSVDTSDLTVAWEMCQDTDNAFTLTGLTTNFMANFTGICNCSVAVASSSSEFTATVDFTMAVKYVRREIRSLSDDDRNTWLKALNTIYTLSEDEGQELYGSKYHDADFYSAKHLNGAGVSDCDHWHDGAGLLVHHMAFTLMVEQTLQAINPAIAMPYWEYGMDSYLYSQWEDSPIFGADWFGEEPTNGDHVISDGGMWEGISVGDGSRFGDDWSISDSGSINPFENAYGQLRSPWNNNPDARIGRKNTTYGMSQYSSMPTCVTLKACFESDSLADINECTNGATHGPVHILIGGSWGDDSFTDAEYVRQPAKLLFFKVLWRMGWTRCPTTCDTDDHATCKCAVPQEYIDTYGAYYILESANIIYPVLSELANADDDDYLALLRAVEDPGIVGDFYSSAAAFDPIFWPLHGAAERLVSLKRLYISLGESAPFDSTWAFAEYNKYSAAAYLDGVCDWSGVSDPYTDLTLPNCTMGAACYGHGETDILDFSSFISDETYTNIEFFEFIHPWTDELPYVYETYDFDYCSSYGYSFDPMAASAPLAGPGPDTTTPSTDHYDNLYNVMTESASTPGMTGKPLGPMTGATTSGTMNAAPRQSSNKRMKSEIKARSASRKEVLSAVEKADIPLELVSKGIVSYSTLKEYSESRRKL